MARDARSITPTFVLKLHSRKSRSALRQNGSIAIASCGMNADVPARNACADRPQILRRNVCAIPEPGSRIESE
ncbi:MAG TPA: hypothetical protein VFL36_09005 [Myxococcales bacterium]|nr:hypothetical protein [Myxococcales bacterium]